MIASLETLLTLPEQKKTLMPLKDISLEEVPEYLKNWLRTLKRNYSIYSCQDKWRWIFEILFYFWLRLDATSHKKLANLSRIKWAKMLIK